MTIINRKKFIGLTLLILFVCILSTINAQEVLADNLTFAVSPSVIEEYRIQPGETKEIIFTVGNRTVFENSKSVDKNKLYTMTLDINYSLEDCYGDNIKEDNKGIIKFNKETVTVAPMKADKVKATISIPKDFEMNEYTLYVTFTRKPIKGLENEYSNVSAIKVPVYIFAGDENFYNKQNPDFSIEDLRINLGQNELTTVNNEVRENLKKLITVNPSKIIDTFKNIKNKPVYALNNENVMCYDINNNYMTTYINLLASNKINDWKYLNYTESQGKSNVENVLFNEKGLEFVLDDGTTYKVELDNSMIDKVRDQLIKYPDYKEMTLENLLSKLYLPINKTYKNYNYNSTVGVVNTGSKVNKLVGTLKLFRNNTDLICESKIDSFILNLKEPKQLQVPIIDKLEPGAYLLQVDMIGKANVQKSKEISFIVDNTFRNEIYSKTLTIYLLIISSIILFILLILLYLRSKIGYMKQENVRVIRYKTSTAEYECAIVIHQDAPILKKLNKKKDKILKLAKIDESFKIIKHIEYKEEKWIKIKHKNLRTDKNMINGKKNEDQP